MRNTKCVSKRFALDESQVHPYPHPPATAAPNHVLEILLRNEINANLDLQSMILLICNK